LRRYYFDVDDGRHHVHDEVGRKLTDRDVAVIEAGIILRSLSQIRVFQGRPGTTSVRVRDANGRQVYESSIQFEG
jgi:hypothetical protein